MTRPDAAAFFVEHWKLLVTVGAVGASWATQTNQIDGLADDVQALELAMETHEHDPPAHRHPDLDERDAVFRTRQDRILTDLEKAASALERHNEQHNTRAATP